MSDSPSGLTFWQTMLASVTGGAIVGLFDEARKALILLGEDFTGSKSPTACSR